MSAKYAILHEKRLKNIAIVLLIIILSTILFPSINVISYGSQYREQTNIDEIDNTKYPGYKELLKKLKEAHPNWSFTLLYTGLDWNTVLYEEKNDKIGHDANLIQGKSGEWVCQENSCLNEDGSSKAWEGTNWYCASHKALSYYMDPRNFLTESEVFQFERLSYVEGIYTLDGIEKILAGTFMSNTSPKAYYGNDNYSSNTFAQIMLDVGSTNGISPYHIASRIRQEIVKSGGTPSDSVTGKVEKYKGVYNFFNIGASTGNGAIERGLEYAQKKGWTSPEVSITEGAKYIAERYIAIGQDTLYLQKFKVDSQDGKLYTHQYQANIQAPQTEGRKIYKSYNELNLLESNINFIIPVYENMPQTISQIPSDLSSNEGDIVKVIANGSLQLRKEPGTDKENLCSLSTGTLVIRLEKNVATVNDLQWDKVKTIRGVVGYVASKYLEVVTPKIEDTMKKVEIDSNNKIIKCEPNANISDLLVQNATAIVKNKNGEIITDTTTAMATGNVVTIGEAEYKVVKLGDTSGDGVVDPRDSLRVLKYSVGTYQLEGEYFSAGDINKDGVIDSRDSLRILRYAVNSFKIEL